MLTVLDLKSDEEKQPVLTPREYEVLRLIARGLSTHEMADEMSVSFHTIETHRKRLIEKFDSRNSAELVKKANKLFWI